MSICLALSTTVKLQTEYRSVFPALDALLESSKTQRRLLHIKGSVLRRKFRSIQDFILVSVLPEHSIPCHRFYKGEGPCLEDLPGVNYDVLEAIDLVLCEIVKAVCSPELRDEKITWEQVRSLLV